VFLEMNRKQHDEPITNAPALERNEMHKENRTYDDPADRDVVPL
jgi:hypothetical protein